MEKKFLDPKVYFHFFSAFSTIFLLISTKTFKNDVIKIFCGVNLLETLVILKSLGKKAGHTPCFFSVEFLESLRLSIWFKLLEVLTLWKIYEKTLKKWKKHSVLIIFPCHSLNQNSSTSDLSFSQVTSVEKRKSRKHFSASASKNFSSVSFFLLR